MAAFAEGLGAACYMPSVAPGWDASARGADFGDARPDMPVVAGGHRRAPGAVPGGAAARRASSSSPHGVDDPLVLVASLNEWSEGHYLEPDPRFGMGWLEAVRDSL